MKPFETYTGDRGQTYVKHFFLEKYLERVAYNIGSSPSADEFVYVDGFSGPWRSDGEDYGDTSFMIATDKLKSVKSGLAKINRHPKIRCLFIEENATRFADLDRTTKSVAGLDEIRALHGSFENLIPQIQDFIGKSFSFVFVDPTGWQGIGLKRIAPLLAHKPGEVLVNFMFDFINRFLGKVSEAAKDFDELFGGTGWQAAITEGPRREATIIDFYQDRMRAVGGFDYVTSTRILKPTEDRSYFYLVYGTRHPKGLVEFREAEKATVEEQERVRDIAKQAKRVKRTKQNELFSAASTPSGPSAEFEAERDRRCEDARRRVEQELQSRPDIPYQNLLPFALERPLVWESDFKAMLEDLEQQGLIEIRGRSGKERTPKKGHLIVWKREKS